MKDKIFHFPRACRKHNVGGCFRTTKVLSQTKDQYCGTPSRNKANAFEGFLCDSIDHSSLKITNRNVHPRSPPSSSNDNGSGKFQPETNKQPFPGMMVSEQSDSEGCVWVCVCVCVYLLLVECVIGINTAPCFLCCQTNGCNPMMFRRTSFSRPNATI